MTTAVRDIAKVGAQIGRSVPRLEGREKVTGRAEYTHTMRIPGMLHAKLFRSTLAHGRIVSIDTSAAKKVRGVAHVITIDDVKKVIPDPYYGPAFHDQPILADGKVRFVGEPVAAVLAADPHVADEAVQLITAQYEELPAVYDEGEALTAHTYVHDELRPAGAFADLQHLKGMRNTNVALEYRLRRGDLKRPMRRPRTGSSTSFAARRCCIFRSSRSPPSRTTEARA
jgi:CO/xanthine dehydrogenase Mo-binding subunit